MMPWPITYKTLPESFQSEYTYDMEGKIQKFEPGLEGPSSPTF